MGLTVIILAAGRGKRMVSDLPKVLHPVGGQPMLQRVVDSARRLEADQIIVVHGNGGDHVQAHLPDLPVTWVKQESQLGTGHAVEQALPHCRDDDQVLILYADVPLISIETLQRLLNASASSGVGLVVVKVPDPTGFGRIIRNELGNIVEIVEHRDATDLQLGIQEINTGIMSASAAHLKQWLPQLTTGNQQHEYYLTDIVAMAVRDELPVGGVLASSAEEVQGVNNRWQLAQLERYYQREIAKRLCFEGVTVADPYRLDVRGTIDIAQDVFLDVNIVLEGRVVIGRGCQIGAGVCLRDVELGDGVVVYPHSVVEGATIEAGCRLGPFARIRPGTILRAGSRVGNFTELKKATVGASSKVNHLSYVGDAVIGEGVNIGAGTITCNYDGVNKFQTVIEDGAFIGSNTSLVAPVVVGCGATIGAGSTVTQDAPSDTLTVARAKQQVIEGWERPVKRADAVVDSSDKV